MEIRKNVFTLRAERIWREMPEWVKQAESINAFKNAYDRWMEKGEKSSEDEMANQTNSDERGQENDMNGGATGNSENDEHGL